MREVLETRRGKQLLASLITFYEPRNHQPIVLFPAHAKQS